MREAGAAVELLGLFSGNYKLEKNFALMTKRGSHFTSEVLQQMAAEKIFMPNFAIIYANWANVEIEVANKKVLSFIKSLRVPLILERKNHATAKSKGRHKRIASTIAQIAWQKAIAVGCLSYICNQIMKKTTSNPRLFRL
eukprot:snap_masked-scaffold_111-processed-gene-0.3-mRNA-1 protein AED:1.00 eAED:1.00 QI:0/0/0/0/1/1/2/0/139